MVGSIHTKQRLTTRKLSSVYESIMTLPKEIRRNMELNELTELRRNRGSLFQRIYFCGQLLL